jgi:hypothetical protein
MLALYSSLPCLWSVWTCFTCAELEQTRFKKGKQWAQSSAAEGEKWARGGQKEGIKQQVDTKNNCETTAQAFLD